MIRKRNSGNNVTIERGYVLIKGESKEGKEAILSDSLAGVWERKG